jgi:hypothetical protein
MKYMKRTSLITVLITTFTVFILLSCDTGKTDQIRISDLEEKISRLEEMYKPGLHSLMNETLYRHSNLWFAGQAENWELAYYQHHELEEIFEDIVELHPEYDDEPVGLLIGSMMNPSMEDVETSIENRDPLKFRAAFTNLTRSCNTCHEATNREMITITEPEANTVRNLRF